MKKHFVTFYSPGTFVHETRSKPIESWDVDKAKEMAKDIVERHGAKPFGFSFSTRGRLEDLDSKVIEESCMYYLGGKVETYEEVKARATEGDRVLVSNMEYNDIKRIITNTNSWKVTQPFNDDDVLLEWP